MGKKFNLFLIFALTLIMFCSLSSAWIVPDTHDYISKEALEIVGSGTQISQTISNNFADFSACTSITDYSVFLYFTEGFNTIGKTYLASHSGVNVCSRAIELADKGNQEQLACAYGICAMSLEDSPSHNGFVPGVIQKTGLVNGLVHALGEQCVNNKIPNHKQLNLEGRQALANNYAQHRDYLIKVFSSEQTSDIDVPKMMDAFVSEVSQSKQYSVGFRGFTAVPTSIHIFFLVLFVLFLLLLGKLIKKKNKKLSHKVLIWILSILSFLIILLYVLYFTGTLWKFFQVASRPLCAVVPISGYENYINQAVNNMANFMNNGVSVTYSIPDPSGLNALNSASSKNTWKIYLISFLFLIVTIVITYFTFKKKK